MPSGRGPMKAKRIKRQSKMLALGSLLWLAYTSSGYALTDTAVLTPSQPTLDWPIQSTAGQRIMAAIRCSDPATLVDVTLIGPDGVVMRERHRPTGAHFLFTVPKSGAYHIHVVGEAIGAPVPVEFFLHYLPSNGQ